MNNPTLSPYYSQIELVLLSEEGDDNRNIFRKLSNTLILACKTIVEEEAEIFATHHARLSFIYEQRLLPKEIYQELVGIGYIRKSLLKGSKMEITEDIIQSSLKAIVQLIAFIDGEEIPDNIKSLLKRGNESELKLTDFVKEDQDAVEFLRGIVMSVSGIKTSENGIKYCYVNCINEADGQYIEVALSDMAYNINGELKMAPHMGGQISRIAMLAWKFANIHFFNLRKIENGDQVYYASTGETMVVLEPDYLVDVTSIASCFQWDNNRKMPVANPFLYLLNQFMPGPSGTAILKGKLVNDFLDELLVNPDVNRNEIFWDCLMQNSLTAVRIGQEEMAELRESVINDHVPNLVGVRALYKNKSLNIEPTFISDKYGMQGRLDVLVEDLNNVNSKDVFELKSGKPPKYGAWEGHKMQVICYNMLLKSVFSELREGSSSIFYSLLSSSDRNRKVDSNIKLEQNVIMLRNKLVYIIHQLSLGDFRMLDRLKMSSFGYRPSYTDEDLRDFENTYNKAQPIEIKYFQAYLAFIYREQRSAKVGDGANRQDKNDGFASLWRLGLNDKVDSFQILHNLSFDRAEGDSDLLCFERNNKEITNFRKGDIVVLYPQDDDGLHPLNYQIYKGSIDYLDEEVLKVQLRNKQVSVEAFSRMRHWVAEKDFMESSFNVLTKSLYSFLKAPSYKKDLILGLIKPQSIKLPEIDFPYLTYVQKELVQKALEAEDYFLLQGPPGTGKTSAMLMSVVKYVMDTSQQTITILAFTNKAVDEIAHKLYLGELDYIRLGGSNKEDPNILRNQIKEKNLDQITEMLKTNRIFISTVSSFLSRQNELADIINFDLLIIDEASQLLEPHLVGVLPNFRKFIMIGDQNQLPAVCTQKSNTCTVEDEELHELGICDLRQSLFERLFHRCENNEWTHAYGTLTNHFRMHEEIAALVNPFYYNLLEAYTERQKIRLEIDDVMDNSDYAQLLKNRVVFIPSDKSIESKSNTQEAKRVCELLHYIRKVKGKAFSEKTVGVITPWRAQINKINSLIDDKELSEKVMIDTVERYQGGEKDIIILSLAVYHKSQLKSLESLSADGQVDRKLNVAISRAREQIIILGYENAITESIHYNKLLKHIKKVGYFANNLVINE